MAYRMKKSPINKGTAAKPSPMKEPIITAALIGLGATALGAGAGAIQGSKNRKKQDEIQKAQEEDNIIANMQQGLTKDVSMKKTNLLGD